MKVAILTNFMEFLPGYSLTGIVKDQARMLAEYGNEVLLFVNDKYNGETFSEDVRLCKRIPFAHLKDYRSQNDIIPEHREIIKKTTEILVEDLKDADVAFTHDFVFTGWFILYGLACMEASKQLPNLRWMHWIHSVPTAGSDFWNIQKYGNAHKLIYPNESDKIRVAEQFRGTVNHVRIIPHIKDLRSWFDFDPETCDFIKQYPGVMQADVVQVYPASVDRLGAKRVAEVIRIFSEIKAQFGLSVCLVLANQWATGRRQKEDINQYKKLAAGLGLEVDKEVVFSSDFKTPKYDVGLPKTILRELMLCANLFIFPTREESFGLVLPEAVLSGGPFCVLNKSLTMQLEISGYNAMYFDFGSYHMDVHHEDEKKWIRDVATIIYGRMRQNEGILLRTYVRQRYNWNHLYQKYYLPIMMESRSWV